MPHPRDSTSAIVAATVLLLPALLRAQAISIEAEHPLRQEGSQGPDLRRVASGGAVLGMGFGSRPGHFAEYLLEAEEDLAPARISLRYARSAAGRGRLEVALDGEVAGLLHYQPTGGGEAEDDDLAWTSLDLPAIAKGSHLLRLTVARCPKRAEFPAIALPEAGVLDRLGGRGDKSCAGSGRNVALYAGSPSRFFFATHELGDIFSAVRGETLLWYPDQVIVSPQAGAGEEPDIHLDRIVISEAPADENQAAFPRFVEKATAVIDQRQVCVTAEDVVICRVHLHNPTAEMVEHRFQVTGDCRESRGWRGKPGGDKISRRIGDIMILVDQNVFPDLLGGLSMAVGGSEPPARAGTGAAGTYFLEYEVEVPAGGSRELLLACAIDPDLSVAQRRLFATLSGVDPFAAHREQWRAFFDEKVPRFSCSDRGLEELYALRWFLLRFSTAGGDLGLFRHPVVLEGREAYQTYCCYSAPLMAFDLNWAVDPDAGFGHIASMVLAAHEDGRFSWYTAPDTNRVPLHHASGTGLSLLPLAAWKHYLVHGSAERLAEIYPGLLKNAGWWMQDRDPDGDGLFAIDHQLETGMDDLLRWPVPTLRYDAVDASSYAYANLRATADLASVLGRHEDAEMLRRRAEKTAHALKTILWHAESSSWRDRHPQTRKLAEMVTITAFYPFFADVGEREHLAVFREHLLDPERFWLPHPVPALPRSHPDFNPRGFWRGPSWPAATCHVVEALARAGKSCDRSLLPAAAELFLRAARNHLRPRADFYERYDPITGEPLSSFRDDLHSWWIDLVVRHVAGFEPAADGGFSIDPLPLGLDRFALRGIPLRGRRVDVEYTRGGGDARDGSARGLTLRIDGEVILSDPEFEPGGEPLRVEERSIREGGREDAGAERPATVQRS
ncbi:MAG: hypothetical protein JXA90_00520 [Planctomycetes bacterium]|nr:hypothetical protein [Planctomycetota bacterium]